jgi:hypothetical protein
MADVKQTSIIFENDVLCVEQKIAAGAKFNGEAPSLTAEVFVPYYDSDDGIIRMKQHDDPSKDAGDKGGLFEFAHEKPIVIEQVVANFGTSVTFNLYIVGTNGDFQIESGAGAQFISRFGHDKAVILMPEEKVKVVTDTNSLGWVRVYGRLAQGR